MRINIDNRHFFAGQGAVSAMYLPYINEAATLACEKMALSLRFAHHIGSYDTALRLFGITKLHSVCLAWPYMTGNDAHFHRVNRPYTDHE